VPISFPVDRHRQPLGCQRSRPPFVPDRIFTIE